MKCIRKACRRSRSRSCSSLHVLTGSRCRPKERSVFHMTREGSLYPPMLTAVANMKASVSPTGVSFCRRAFIHTLITPLLLEKINSLTNSHLKRWNGSLSVFKWAPLAESESLGPPAASLLFNQDELQPEKKTPGWRLVPESWTYFFLLAEHQLLACLFLILCSLLRWSCLFTLVKPAHLSSPIYKPFVVPADPVTPCHTFKSSNTGLNDAFTLCQLAAIINETETEAGWLKNSTGTSWTGGSHQNHDE